VQVDAARRAKVAIIVNFMKMEPPHRKVDQAMVSLAMASQAIAIITRHSNREIVKQLFEMLIKIQGDSQ